jgi:filamentous hemagglutinin family protein
MELVMKVFPWLLPSLLVTVPVFAEGIATDGSLGAVQNLVGTNVTIPQELGKTVGNNLFHSFSDFNINTGQTVAFSGSDSLQNVISRVTGNNPSIIDGTLKSDIKNADFYFINPHGITFNTNAQVDVPAAFHVSTADKMDFGKNGVFYVDLTKDSQLSSEPPSAFGFLGNSTIGNGLVDINNAHLQLKDGKTFDVVSGSIDIQGNRGFSSEYEFPNMKSIGGEARLVAFIGAGVIDLLNTNTGYLPLPSEIVTEYGGVLLIDSGFIDMSGDGAGKVSIYGGNFFASNGQIQANNTGNTKITDSKGIEIDVQILNATKSLFLVDTDGGGNASDIKIKANNIIMVEGRISADKYGNSGDGKGGGIFIYAVDKILFKDSSYISTSSYGGKGGKGNAGNIEVQANDIEISSGGNIVSQTLSDGNAGTIQIFTENLNINGNGTDGTSTGVITINEEFSNGNAGDIQIKANNINILNGGSVVASSYVNGNAGNIKIVADRIKIDGIDSQISSDALTPPGDTDVNYSAAIGRGNAGNIDIETNKMDILNSARISSQSYLGDKPGHLNINISDNLNINRGSIWCDTFGISNAGTVNIQSKSINLLNGGFISANTKSTGNGGSLNIAADYLKIDNIENSDYLTGVSSYSSSYDNKVGNYGDAGNIIINIKNIDVLNGGVIDSSTYTSGNAGNIHITADYLKINSIKGTQDTAIFSSTYGAVDNKGNAGDITIKARNIDLLNGGGIDSSTETLGKAGNINISVEDLEIYSDKSAEGSGVFSTAREKTSGQTGNIFITVKNRMNMKGGSISIDNGANLTNEQMKIINPGRVNIESPVILMQDSYISARSSENIPSGNINMVVSNYLDMKNNSFITTTSNTGDGGSINVHAGDVTYLQDSGFITTVKGGQGNGGDISARINVLVMDKGIIQANAVSGNGGKIQLALEALIPSRNVLIQGGKPIVWNTSPTNINLIQAASENGVSGTVNNSAPQLNLSGVLANVTNSNFDNNLISQDYCARGQGSSLSKKGKGALPMRPKDFQSF